MNWNSHTPLSSRWFLIGLTFLGIGLPFSRSEELPQPPPSQSLLDSIATRGQLLAKMDQAASRCTDEFLEQDKSSKREGVYLVYSDGNTMKVAFGQAEPDGGAFLTRYEGTIKNEAKRCKLSSFDPPRRDRGWVLQANLALQRASRVLPPHPDCPTYCYTVIRESAGDVSVYFYPGTTDPDVTLLGEDAHILVRTDGTTEVTPYHKTLLKKSPPPKDVEVKASMHTHVIDDLPNPLDVLWVMTRPFKLSEIILGEKWVFLVTPEGTVQFVMTTDEMNKAGQAKPKGGS